MWSGKEQTMNNYGRMREALGNTLDALKSLSKSHGTDLPEDVRALLGGMAFTVNAALSAPPRNCDVGTAEEQTARYKTLCRTQKNCNPKCPVMEWRGTSFANCEIAWAQMPYNESEVKNVTMV